MQANFPTLAITLTAVNEFGQDAGNSLIVANRDLTLLQDGDQNQNQQSDVWDESWQVTWRDLVVLNGENEKEFVVNLTTFDLGNTANYQQLGRALVQLAIEDQRPWCNATNVLDVDENGVVEIDDFQLVVSHLNQQGPSTLSPSVVPSMKLDCDYDGYSAPLDALRILNYLNAPAAGGEGEAFVELPEDSWLDLATTDSAAWDQAFDEYSSDDGMVRALDQRNDLRVALTREVPRSHMFASEQVDDMYSNLNLCVSPGGTFEEYDSAASPWRLRPPTNATISAHGSLDPFRLTVALSAASPRAPL